MKIRLDYNNMMKAQLEDGVSSEDILKYHGKISEAAKALAEKRAAGKIGFMDLPHNQSEVCDDIINYVEANKGIDAFVVLGIGGSALGPIAVQQALNHPYYNELPREKRGGYPKLYVLDNVDPERLVYFLQTVDPTKCIFNVISKSGSTSETMSQFMIIKKLLEDKLGADGAKKHIVCTTDPENGNLVKIAKQEKYKTYYIPQNVGGRFSELTPVGLLAAAFCGIDIKELLAGAALMDNILKEPDVEKNPAFMFALLHYIGMLNGKNITVMMPYADSLKFISDWFAHLWAESLGKMYDNEGKVVNVGQTPVKALGVTDQHSQVQLYMEGPYDKIIVFLGVDEFKETITIPKIYSDIPSLGFLGGATHNELIKTEQMATEFALTKYNRQNMTITLPKVNANTIGQLLYFFEVATAVGGELLNIDAFDQPGVEEGKNATYAMFDRPGYDEKKKEIESRPEKNAKYVI